VLAESLNVTKNTFRQWTNGNATPTVEKLIKLSEYFNVSSDYLLGLSDIKTRDEDAIMVCKVTGLSELAVSELKSSIVVLYDALNALLETESGIMFLMYLDKALEVAHNSIKYKAEDTVTIDTIVKAKDRYAMFTNKAISSGNYYEDLQNYYSVYMTRILQSLIKGEETDADINDNKQGRKKWRK